MLLLGGNIFLETCRADFCQQVLFVKGLQRAGSQVQRAVLNIQQKRIRIKGGKVCGVATLPVVHGVFEMVQGFRFSQPVQNVSATFLFRLVQRLGQAANGGSQFAVGSHGNVAEHGVGFFLPALAVPVHPPIDLRHELPVASNHDVKPFRVARIGVGQVHEVLNLGLVHGYPP